MRLFCLSLFLMIGFSPVGNSEADPWQSLNKNTHNFNEVLDKSFATPLAKGYLYITPDILEHGITNFISNVEDVSIGVNNVLQGNLKLGLLDISRVILNSTIGLAGFIDFASAVGLQKHDEDFGQTLAVWGVSSGPYFILPVLGPSTLRDAFGKIPNSFLSPTLALDDNNKSYTYTAIDLIETRARYLGFDSLVHGNKYLFFKDAYFQQREFEISNGIIEDNFDSLDDFNM